MLPLLKGVVQFLNVDVELQVMHLTAQETPVGPCFNTQSYLFNISFLVV